MDKVYVIYECTGEYEMYCETPLGFKLSEEEAKRYVNKKNDYYNDLENIMFEIDYYEFQKEVWEWEEIAEGITENVFNTTDIPGYKDGHVTNANEYTQWTLKFLSPLLDKKRYEYFTNHADKNIQKFLPEGKTWKEFLKLYDDYEDYKQFLYSYRYECVTKLEDE